MMKLTIITICYNDSVGLRKTLQSAANQTYKIFEHIVVDGGSVDNTLDVIKQYPHITNWVSEHDSGIFEAMNKGIRMARGEYILFLNSGDSLENNVVVESFMDNNPSADIVTGIERMPDGQLVFPPKNKDLSYSFFYNDTLLHQSSFIRKDAFDRYGMYREDYRIVSDWEWFFRTIVRDGATYESMDFIVSNFDGKGISSDPKYRELQDRERIRVHQELMPRVRSDYNEMLRLINVENEYNHLKNGRFGPIVKLLLKLKANKKYV